MVYLIETPLCHSAPRDFPVSHWSAQDRHGSQQNWGWRFLVSRELVFESTAYSGRTLHGHALGEFAHYLRLEGSAAFASAAFVGPVNFLHALIAPTCLFFNVNEALECCCTLTTKSHHMHVLQTIPNVLYLEIPTCWVVDS